MIPTTSGSVSSEPAGWCFRIFRPGINGQCFLGILLICVLVIFAPLLLTEKVGSINWKTGHIRHISYFSDLIVGSPHNDTAIWNGSDTRPHHAEERATIRETWGFHGKLCRIRIIFGMGAGLQEDQQDKILLENSVYNDILQTKDINDAYHNQTRLVLSFFRWGLDHCQGASFIGKADEDTWINVFGVLNYFDQHPAHNSIYGHFLWSEKVKRLVEEKWYLTKDEYANDTYPPFAVGQLYVFHFQDLPRILRASETITIHWLDDVFIAGQIPDLLKMKLVHIQERAHLYEVEGYECPGRDYFIIHASSASKNRWIFYNECMQKFRRHSCRRTLLNLNNHGQLLIGNMSEEENLIEDRSSFS